MQLQRTVQQFAAASSFDRDARRVRVDADMRPAAEETAAKTLREPQDMLVRKPVATSAAALYGRVQLDASRRQATAPELPVVEPKVSAEAAPERLVAPVLRVEQASLPDAVRMQQTTLSPEAREQVSQSLQDQVMRAIIRAAHRILGRMNAQFVEMSNYISKQHGRY